MLLLFAPPRLANVYATAVAYALHMIETIGSDRIGDTVSALEVAKGQMDRFRYTSIGGY